MPTTIETIEDLLVDQIRDLYDAEKQLVRALPKMAKAASSDQLRQTIEDHLEETTNQVARLEQAFEQLNKPSKSKTCKAMKGLIEEGGEVIEEKADEPMNDLALIAAAQRVEHYEISAYGTARAMAEHLGEDQVAALLEETEEEEKAADKKLTDIALVLMHEDATSRKETGATPKKAVASRKGQTARAQRM